MRRFLTIVAVCCVALCAIAQSRIERPKLVVGIVVDPAQHADLAHSKIVDGVGTDQTADAEKIQNHSNEQERFLLNGSRRGTDGTVVPVSHEKETLSTVPGKPAHKNSRRAKEEKTMCPPKRAHCLNLEKGQAAALPVSSWPTVVCTQLSEAGSPTWTGKSSWNRISYQPPSNTAMLS